MMSNLLVELEKQE
jgi:hypothetical protein